LGTSVLAAARERISWTFDTFPRIYLSFSGGKDSSVMFHLVMDEAKKRRQKVGVLFVDLEAQYKLTIDHCLELFETYKDWIEPFWISLPIKLRNAVSQFENQWMAWEPEREADWVRKPPKIAITDRGFFPFFRQDAMEFEEFTPQFAEWYAQGKPTASFVGIRTDESLNRWRTICKMNKQTMDGKPYTTWNHGTPVFSVYPIYDWRTRDIWIYHAKNPDRPHNQLYDRMHKAGLSIHQMRICQPYGDDQRKGLWLFHAIEPETWKRVVARVNGANQGALYAKEAGNILGNMKVAKPDGHSWESFAMMILESMPSATAEHFRNKVAVFLKWYEERGYPSGIPDDGPLDKSKPSWKRICKTLLRNDYWCKGLSFSQHKSEAYEKYLKLMRRRRREWGLI